MKPSQIHKPTLQHTITQDSAGFCTFKEIYYQTAGSRFQYIPVRVTSVVFHLLTPQLCCFTPVSYTHLTLPTKLSV